MALPRGTLQFTRSELIFKAGIFAKPWLCQIRDIVKVEETSNPLGPVLSWGVSCFRLILEDGHEEVFSVANVKDAIDQLNDVMKKSKA